MCNVGGDSSSDPAEARPFILSREQFESAWVGELLLFTKRANLRLQDLTFDFTWFIPAISMITLAVFEAVLGGLRTQLFRRPSFFWWRPSAARTRENLVTALFQLNAARVNVARSTGNLNALN